MRVYAITILVSVVAHWALVGGLSRAARGAPKRSRIIELAVVTPSPVVIPEPPPPEPKKEAQKRPLAPHDVKPVELPPEQTPPPNTEQTTEEPPKPVFGISMSSTVSGNSGFQVRVGNTTMKDPDKDRVKPEDVKPYAATEKFVPVYALATPPRVRGSCPRIFPPEARAAQVRGSIKLDLLILEDGTVGEAAPLNDLGYGTQEAAVRAMKQCKFTPGKDGSGVVRTRITYLYTFNFEDD